MADVKTSAEPLLASPSSQTALPAIDPGTDPTKNYKVTRAELMKLLETIPLKQVQVAAGITLNLTVAAHMGATIVLAGVGATLSIDAATLGDGFACKVINDTTEDWTVPAPTGATRRWDDGGDGHTKVTVWGSCSLETYTRAGTRYLHISGTTA